MALSVPYGPCGSLDVDEVVIGDTETTGLHPFGLDRDGLPTNDPDGPDRLCSVAFSHLVRRDKEWVTRAVYHWVVDPGRPVPEAAAKVNGFTWNPRLRPQSIVEGRSNLYGAPKFSDVADRLLDFVGGRPIGFHNNVFDVAVLDAELVRVGMRPLGNAVFCTKKAFSDIQGRGRPSVYQPGTNLNALCELLGVDRSARIMEDGRELHGAPVDTRLAAACFAILEPLGWMILEDADSLPHRQRMAA